MVDDIEIPHIDWYSKISEAKKLKTRYPLASLEFFPRYYQSLSLLRNASSTGIKKGGPTIKRILGTVRFMA